MITGYIWQHRPYVAICFSFSSDNLMKLEKKKLKIFSAAGVAQHYQEKKFLIMRHIPRLETTYAYQKPTLRAFMSVPLFYG